EKGKAGDQANGPDHQEPEKRHRTVDREESLATAVRIDRPGDPGPRLPSTAVIDPREAPASRHGSRQDDGFERVPQDRRDQNEAAEERQVAHDSSPCDVWEIVFDFAALV